MMLVLILAPVFICCRKAPGEKTLTGLTRDSLRMIVKDDVFGDDRPFLQSHASTLVHANDGKFLIAWFGGTHEKHDDVGIWLSAGRPGQWSPPVEIAKVREDPHWNPVFFKTDKGKLILFFKVGRSIDLWETWFMTSNDNGTTWTEAQELVPGDRGGRGPVKNKMIILSDGTWLAPSSNERNGIWNAFVDRSEDEGKTWTSSDFLTINRDSIRGEGVIQPTLWESHAGKVHMLLRSSSGFICRSDSEDFGRTWSPVYKTDLPNPNSGIDLTRLSDGTLVLVYNPEGKNWGSRKSLSAVVSNDNGRTWSVPVALEEGVEGDEFSYPSIISYDDTVALTYTWKRERIVFQMGLVE